MAPFSHAGGKSHSLTAIRIVELDKGDVAGRDTDAPASGIGEPPDAILGDDRLDFLFELLGIVHHDFDQLVRVGDSDASIHAAIVTLFQSFSPSPTL